MNKREIISSKYKFDRFILLSFLLIYNTTDTLYEFSLGGVLRWVACFALVGYHIFYSSVSIQGNTKIALLPNSYLYLIFPFFIQSLWNLNYIGIALSRSISFILYSLALYSLISRAYVNSEHIRTIYMFFGKFTVGFVVITNILNIKNYSLNGDYCGIYVNRTVTSCVLLSVIVLTINMIWQTKFKSLKISFFLLTVLEIYMLFETHSRMAFVGIAFIVIAEMCFMQDNVSLEWRIVIIFATVLFVVLTPWIGQKYNISAINRVFAESNSLSSTGLKRNTWDFGKTLFLQRPVLGWGNNAVYYNTFVIGTRGWGVHSSYLIMLIEGGIIGALFYVLFFLSIVKNIISRYKSCVNKNLSLNDKSLIKTMCIICGVMGLNAVSESFLFSAGNVESLPFWFSLLSLYRFLECKYNEISTGPNNNMRKEETYV